jgi:hypothetical protein
MKYITNLFESLKLNNAAIKIILLYLNYNKYITETISFSYYNDLLSSYEYNIYINSIKTYEDLHDIINNKKNSKLYFSIFVDFCYLYLDVDSYIRMCIICNENKTDKYNNYFILKNIINNKPYYWKEAAYYIKTNKY